MGTDRWWVFRRPLLTDWLFLVGIALGIAGVVRTVIRSEEMSGFAIVLNSMLAVPGGLLFAGIAGGLVREYRCGKRGEA